MRRRNLLLAIGATAAAGTMGTGAFTVANGGRTARISVADDSKALLGLDGCPDSPNAEYVATDGEAVGLDVSGISPTSGGGGGVNVDARIVAHDVFQVCNQGTQLVTFHIVDDPEWPRDDGDRRVDFYLGDATDRSVVGADSAIPLDCGECVCVGFTVRTHGFEGESVLESLDDELALVAEADGECGSGSAPDPDPEPEPEPDPLPIECPDGTTRLATFRREGDTFVARDGYGGHPDWDDHAAAEVISVTNVETNDDGDPVAFEWQSGIDGEDGTYVHAVTAAGTDVKQTFDGSAGSGFGGAIDFREAGVTDEAGHTETIERIGFCAGICWQVDLVEGDARPCLDDDNTYGDDDALIAFRHGGTADEDGPPRGSDQPDIVHGAPPEIEFDYDAGEARVHLTVGHVWHHTDVTLAVHYATCPPGAQDLGRQLLWDSSQVTVSKYDDVTLTANLPANPNEDLVVRPVDRDCE